MNDFLPDRSDVDSINKSFEKKKTDELDRAKELLHEVHNIFVPSTLSENDIYDQIEDYLFSDQRS